MLKPFLPGSSVYAMACSGDGTEFVVGTKAGAVHVCAFAPEAIAPLAEGSICSRQLPHGGAAVLDVAFVTERLVAVANADGGCWVHDIKEWNMRCLATKGGTVCALAGVGPGNLVGLTTDGRLFTWNVEDGRLIDEVQGPRPPRMFSPGADCDSGLRPSHCLYPESSGQLVAFHVISRRLRRLPAHDGPWYLLLASADRCWTFGCQGGGVKTWTPDLALASPDAQGPGSVIGGGTIDANSGSVVLMCENGAAGLYRLQGEKLCCEKELSGKDYRTCVSPDIAAMKAFQEEKAQKEVQGILQEIGQVNGEDTDFGVHYARLDELGYPHLSLALKTEKAIREDKLAEALRCSSTLISLLPRCEAKSQASWARHAKLLERVWMFKEAANVLQRLKGPLSDLPHTPEQVEELRRVG